MTNVIDQKLIGGQSICGTDDVQVLIGISEHTHSVLGSDLCSLAQM